MYSVAVLDDDVRQAEAIAAAVAASSCADHLEPVRVYGVDGIDELVSPDNRVDILLADIKLGEDREDVASLVRRHFPPGCGTQVVYVTGYADEYHTRVYQTEHVYFITKPVSQDDLDAALEKACSKLREHLERPIVVTFDRTTYQILPSKISYVESVLRKVRIVMDDRTIEVYAKLKDIKALLPSSFLQCHKSYLVNMSRIARIKKDSLQLVDGTETPVSQKYRTEARVRLVHYARSLV